MRRQVYAVAIAAVVCSSAQAAETVSYSYDALGRLTAAAHTGTVNNGLQSAIAYDAADNRTGYTVSGAAPASSLSIADASVTEGGALMFTVSRAGVTTTGISVNYATANGTAAAVADYTAASGTLTFAAGESSKTITIATIDDTAVESSETLTVTLANPTTGGALSRAAATGTIVDNDAAASALSVADATVAANGTPLTFHVVLSVATAAPVSVSYATADGPSGGIAVGTTAGVDYVSTSGVITFAVGQTSQDVTVQTIAHKAATKLYLNLSSPVNATIADGQALGTAGGSIHSP